MDIHSRMHSVGVWASENQLILVLVSVADGSKEIAAISDLPGMLDLAVALVTAAAAGGQKEIFRDRHAGRGSSTCCRPGR